MTEGERGRGSSEDCFGLLDQGCRESKLRGMLSKHQRPYGKGEPQKWRVGGAVGDESSRIGEQRVARLPRPRPLRLLACAHSAVQGMPPQKFGAV